MPRLTRRFAAAAAVATGGTLVAALIARKPVASPTGSGPPPLQSLAGLEPIRPPSKLPPFTWQAIGDDGSPVTRGVRDYVGRGVVLNIWATWCDPCIREMPSLARLADALTSSGVVVLPVSLDRTGADAIRPFYRSHAITGLPVLTDPGATSMSALAIAGVPTTLLIGADSTLRGRLEGAADWGTPAAIASVIRLIAP